MRRSFFNINATTRQVGKGKDMAFEAITTQEQFDEKVLERVGRAKDSVRKEFEGWISPEDQEKKTSGLNRQITDLNGTINKLNEKIKNHDKEIADRDSKIKAYETGSVKIRVAREKGLPYEAVEFITGDDEDSIGKSADALKGLFKDVGGEPPAPNPEGSGGKEKDDNESYKEALKKLRGGKE